MVAVRARRIAMHSLTPIATEKRLFMAQFVEMAQVVSHIYIDPDKEFY